MIGDLRFMIFQGIKNLNRLIELFGCRNPFWDSEAASINPIITVTSSARFDVRISNHRSSIIHHKYIAHLQASCRALRALATS